MSQVKPAMVVIVAIMIVVRKNSSDQGSNLSIHSGPTASLSATRHSPVPSDNLRP